MSSKRNTRYAMSENEKVAHKRNLRRKRQQKWRKERKTALSLVPPENLSLYNGHSLGKVVDSVFEEKSKARKQAKKQYDKILNNPRLLAEKKHKDSWRKLVHRAYKGVFNRWKNRESDEARILRGCKTLKKELELKLDRRAPEFKICKSWRADFFYTNFYDRIVDDFDLV